MRSQETRKKILSSLSQRHFMLGATQTRLAEKIKKIPGRECYGRGSSAPACRQNPFYFPRGVVRRDFFNDHAVFSVFSSRKKFLVFEYLFVCFLRSQNSLFFLTRLMKETSPGAKSDSQVKTKYSQNKFHKQIKILPPKAKIYFFPGL